METTIFLPARYRFHAAPLKAAIAFQGIKQRQLARERGCTEIHISRVLNGTPPALDLALWLCKRLGVPYREVLPDVPESFLPAD